MCGTCLPSCREHERSLLYEVAELKSFLKISSSWMMWQQTRWNYEEKIYKNPLFRSVIPLVKTLERSSQTAILWWMPGTYRLLHVPSDGRMAKCKQAQDSVSSVGITEAPFLPSSAWDRSILFWEYVSSYLLLYNKPLRQSGFKKIVFLSLMILCASWAQLAVLLAGLEAVLGRACTMFLTHRTDLSVLQVASHPLGFPLQQGH